MLSSSITLPPTDLPHAAGHVRAALECAGVEDFYLSKTAKGIRGRGIRGRSGLAVFMAFTPLTVLGVFSRCAVEINCRQSLNEGEDSLHVQVRVRCLREFDDQEEVDWVTRGPAEMLGDALQCRRVLRKVMAGLSRPVTAEPEGYGLDPQLTPKERRERFQKRYRLGKRRRNIQLALAGLVLVCICVVEFWKGSAL